MKQLMMYQAIVLDSRQTTDYRTDEDFRSWVQERARRLSESLPVFVMSASFEPLGSAAGGSWRILLRDRLQTILARSEFSSQLSILHELAYGDQVEFTIACGAGTEFPLRLDPALSGGELRDALMSVWIKHSQECDAG